MIFNFVGVHLHCIDLKHPCLFASCQAVSDICSLIIICDLPQPDFKFPKISVAFQEDDIEIVGYRHYNTKVFLVETSWIVIILTPIVLMYYIKMCAINNQV